MSDKIFALLRPLDIFGLVPLMTFARAPKVYSRLSMALSLSTLAVILFIILYLGIAVVQRRNPSFFQYSLPSTSVDDKLMFGADTFPIKLSKEIGTLVYGTDFFFDAYISTETPVDRVFEFDEAECPDDPTLECFPQSEEVGKSYLMNSGSDSFHIDLYQCATPGVGCASASDLDTQFSKGSFFFNYNDQVVDPYDFDEPIKDRIMQNGEPLMKNVYKLVVIYLQETEFTTDDGWLLESLTTKRALSVDSIITYHSDITDEYRASLLIKHTGNKIVYKRTYPKIQDLLAQISGIIAVMIPVVAVIAFPYAELKMKEYMVNELYEVKLTNKDDVGKGQMKGKNKKVQGEKVKVKTKQPSKSILPANFGAGNRQKIEDKSSPEKDLISSSPRTKGHPYPFSESFENSRINIGSENGFITEKGTAVSRPSGVTSIGDARKSSFVSNNQTKFNSLKRQAIMPQQSPVEEGEGDSKLPPQKEVEDLLDKLPDEANDEAIEVRGEPVFLNEARHSDKLHLTFGQFIKSYFRPQPEVEIIKKVSNDLTDTMDLATLAKKSSDLDKLKAILFSAEERAIFDNLPISVVMMSIEKQENSVKEKIVVNHHKWEQSLRGNVEKVNEAYTKLREMEEKTELQRKLLGFYESQYLEDYLAQLEKNSTEKK